MQHKYCRFACGVLILLVRVLLLVPTEQISFFCAGAKQTFCFVVLKLKAYPLRLVVTPPLILLQPTIS
jgi:hypothetical protein